MDSSFPVFSPTRWSVIVLFSSVSDPKEETEKKLGTLLHSAATDVKNKFFKQAVGPGAYSASVLIGMPMQINRLTAMWRFQTLKLIIE